MNVVVWCMCNIHKVIDTKMNKGRAFVHNTEYAADKKKKMKVCIVKMTVQVEVY